MLQPKEILCLFVSCFYLLGNPLTDGAYAMLMYKSLYCIAQPCYKRMSSDIVWLKHKITALACAVKRPLSLTYGVDLFQGNLSGATHPFRGGGRGRSRGLDLKPPSKASKGA